MSNRPLSTPTGSLYALLSDAARDETVELLDSLAVLAPELHDRLDAVLASVPITGDRPVLELRMGSAEMAA